MAQFDFANLFAQSYNRAADRNSRNAVSKAELQMRARQLQEQVLTNQVQREAARLQMQLDRSADERADEMHDIDMEVKGQQGDYYAAQGEKISKQIEDMSRRVTLGEEYGEISADLVGQSVHPDERIRYSQLLNSYKTGALTRKKIQAELDSINEARELRNSIQELIGDQFEYRKGQINDALAEPQRVRDVWNSLPDSEKQKYDGVQDYTLKIAKRAKDRGLIDNATFEAVSSGSQTEAPNMLVPSTVTPGGGGGPGMFMGNVARWFLEGDEEASERRKVESALRNLEVPKQAFYSEDDIGKMTTDYQLGGLLGKNPQFREAYGSQFLNFGLNRTIPESLFPSTSAFGNIVDISAVQPRMNSFQPEEDE